MDTSFMNWGRSKGVDYAFVISAGSYGDDGLDIGYGTAFENIDEVIQSLKTSFREHISELIEPSLQKGYFVISDRFIDATYAYQGGGRGVDLNVIKTLENMVHPNLKPDLTLLLDAPLDICAKRVNSRKFKDRFEQEQDDFFEKVRNSYLQRANQEPQRIKIVNANQSIKGVKKSIENELLKAFNES